MSNIMPLPPKRKKMGRGEVDFLSREEYDALYNYLLSNGRNRQRNALLLHTLIVTGQRVNDVLSVRPEDYSFENKTIDVYIHKSGFWLQLPMSMELAYETSIYIGQNKIEKDAPVFDINRQQAWKILKDAGAASINRRVHPHMIRHTTGMWMRQTTGYIAGVQGYLGHASDKTTKKYYASSSLDERRMMLERSGIK